MWSPFGENKGSEATGGEPDTFWRGFWLMAADKKQTDNVFRWVCITLGVLAVCVGLVVVAIVVGVCFVIVLAAKELHGIPLSVTVPLGLGGSSALVFTTAFAARKVRSISRAVKSSQDSQPNEKQ